MKSIVFVVVFAVLVCLCAADTTYYLDQYWTSNDACTGTADYILAVTSGYCDSELDETYVCSADGKYITWGVDCDDSCDLSSCDNENFTLAGCVGDNETEYLSSLEESCGSLPAAGGFQLSYYSEASCSGDVIAAEIFSSNCVNEEDGTYYTYTCSGGAATYTYDCTDSKCTTGCSSTPFPADDCIDDAVYGASVEYACAAGGSSGSSGTASTTGGSAAITFSVATVLFGIVACFF